jgi:3-keto-5-aminohexanoate cleavage enzyme
MNDDAVIVEVGLNEAVSPAVQPNVAQSPPECAADALRCADAGAAIVHWHAADAGGQRLGDTDLYGAALDLIDGRVLAYPSYPTDVADVVSERLAHCLALRERNGLEIAPIDVATVNLVLWDGGSDIAPIVPMQGDVIRNSLPFVIDALRQYRSVGLVPTLAAFDLGSTRTIAALAAAGLLDSPVLLKIFLWGSPCIGPEPSVEALELHLRQLPADLDVEWILVPYGIAQPDLIEDLALAALERGGSIRIGIGDNPTAYPQHSNAQLVALTETWATQVGRPLATPDDVRRRFAAHE